MLQATKPRFLAALIITIPLLLVAVSGQRNVPRSHILNTPNNGRINLNAANARLNVFTEIRNRSHAREFLQAHNKVRFHSGEPPYQWDRNLARYARRFAANRSADCKMEHTGGSYGENIFWGSRDHWTPTEIVRSWVSEHKHYKRETNQCAPGQMCGHYTQIVWRESVRLGCARIKCYHGGVFALCVYEPAGNYLNESPFGKTNESPATATSSSPGTASAQNATPSG